MPAPNAEMFLRVADCQRISDWILWVYPAAPADRQLNQRLCDLCDSDGGTFGAIPEAESAEAPAAHEEPQPQPSAETSRRRVLDALVSELPLPAGILLTLQARGLETVRDLVRYTPADILAWPSTSAATLSTIERSLAKWGLRLGDLAAAPPILRDETNKLAITTTDAETMLRWFTYLPMHSRTADDRSVAAMLARFIGVPLSVFEDHEGESEHDEATFDILEDDPSQQILGSRSDAEPRDDAEGPSVAFTSDLDLSDFAAFFDHDEDEDEDDFDGDEDDDDDEDDLPLDDGDDDSSMVLFEIDEDLIDSLLDGTGVEDGMPPLEADGADAEDPEEPGWQPNDPDAWKGDAGASDDGEGWKRSGIVGRTSYSDGFEDPSDPGDDGDGDDHDLPL